MSIRDTAMCIARMTMVNCAYLDLSLPPGELAGTGTKHSRTRPWLGYATENTQLRL
jgi:hypothetical protein